MEILKIIVDELPDYCAKCEIMHELYHCYLWREMDDEEYTSVRNIACPLEVANPNETEFIRDLMTSTRKHLRGTKYKI